MLGDCPTIHVGGAHELFRGVILQIFLRGLSNKFYRNSVISFREQKTFVLKIVFYLHLDWACKHSSRIMYLPECVCFAMTCALRWGVTHIGNYHYWALLTRSRDHYFRYRRTTLTRGLVLEESRIVALVFSLYNMY